MKEQTSTFGEARIRVISVLAGLTTLLVAFVGSFGLHRFLDDWAYAYGASKAVDGDLMSFLVGSYYHHWSPLWQATETLNFVLAGWESDWFIRSFIILFYALSLAAAWRLTRSLGVGLPGVLTVIGVLGLHHTQAAAIYSFDTYSQCAADTLGWIGAIALWRSLGEETPWRSRSYLVALLLLVVALLYKEQALAAAGVYVGFAVIHFFFSDERPGRLHSLARTCLPIVGVVAVFTILRAVSGLFLASSGLYEPSLGDVPANISQLFLALVTPVRTLFWFDALRAEPIAVSRLAIAGVLTFLVITSIVIGVVVRVRRRPDSRQAALMLACAMVVSWFPVSIMGHVSELYVHTPLFWFAVLVAFAVDGWTLETDRELILLRRATWSAVLVYLAVLGYGLRGNLSEIRETAERAAAWKERLEAAIGGLPFGSRVLIFSHGPDRLPTDYGLYRCTTAHDHLLASMAQPIITYVTDGAIFFHYVSNANEIDVDEAFPEAGAYSPLYELHIGTESMTVTER